MAKNALVDLTVRNLHPLIKAAGCKLVSRRFLLTTLVRLPLIASVVVSSGRTFAARPQRGVDSHVELTIAAVIDRMLPTDELPGAVALGIDRRIAAMPDMEMKRTLAKGVAWLDNRARRQGASDFLNLDDARQEEVLQAALTSNAEGASAIVWTLRRLAFTLYYGDPAISAVFAYSGPPQPSGFPDFQEAPR